MLRRLSEYRGSKDPCGCERLKASTGKELTIRCEEHESAWRTAEWKRLDEERRQRIVSGATEYLRSAGFYREHADAKLEDFPQEIQARARNFLSAAEGFGLLIKGPVGPGKTRLAAAISRELLIQGRQVIAVTVPDLFGRLRASFREGSQETEEKIIAEFRRPAMALVLDDLGFEGSTTPLVISALHRIVSHRNGERSITIATTNLKLKELEQHYGPAIASRLACWEQVVVEGPDRRKKQ